MESFLKTTEQESNYRHLEKMSVNEILVNINREDHLVAAAIQKKIPQIEALTAAVADKMLAGGRLFYIGAGTSGRLGILDASEIPPTFGLPHDLVIGIIAGGTAAIQKPVENAEDDWEEGWNELLSYGVNEKDVVIGIAASGTTPFVIGALQKANERNIITGAITCNEGSPLATTAKFPVEIVVGPEFITGSTRMKSGTAQKLVLNMISTTVMILIGRVEDNKMVNMQLTNNKLIDRGTKMVMKDTDITDYDFAKQLLEKHGSVKKAITAYKK